VCSHDPRCYNEDVNAIEVLPPASAIPVVEQKALSLIDLFVSWRPHPTKVKLLIERARSRVATDSAIAEALGHRAATLSHIKQKDEVFRNLWLEVTYDEETAVLLLAYLTTRGAYATIYNAVNGDITLRKANVTAAQSVIELAERRRRAATGPNPMLKALEEAIG